jgi:hypothetical protein
MGRVGVKKGTESLPAQLEGMRRERDQALAEVERLSMREQAESEYWMPIVFRLGDRTLEETLDDFDNLKERQAGNMAGKGHFSNKLQELRLVAEQVWANADPEDPSSHPANCDAESRLQQLGWSERLARSGASIIRPGWAHKGRPEE